VRPNYVYGIDKRNDFYRLIKLIKTFRICLVIGNGKVKFQPVNKNDVARITAELIKNFKTNLIIDISGNETITINDITGEIKKITGVSFITIHIPIILLQLFRIFIPFDAIEFTSDRLARNPCSFKIYSNIRADLKKILQI
jgi:nucleoside-diphosphate-sugar epimerase